MKLKLNDEGQAVLQDGKPVYIHDDGKEVAFDAPQTVATISRLNGEAKSHRERAETAEKGLKAFEGIEDPAAALKAMQTIANFDEKKLVDAGEVEKVKEEAIKAVRAEYEPQLEEAAKFKTQYYDEKVTNSFAGSKFITEKLAIPAALAQSAFANAFKFEENGIVGYGQDGNKIYSRSKPGEVAGFDEALETLVDQYPHRDNILKSSGASGGGAQGGSGNAGKKQVTRAQFDAMPQSDRKAFATDGGTVV